MSVESTLGRITRRIRESATGAVLTFAGITDGEYLRRSGSTIISGNPSGGSGGGGLLSGSIVLVHRNISFGTPLYITRASSSSFDVGSPTKMTVRMWIVPLALNTNAGLATRGDLANSQGDWALGFFNGSTMRPTFRVNNNGASIQSATDLFQGAPSFVEAGYDSSLGSNNLKLFINGNLDVQGNYSTVITNNAVAMNIGTYFDAGHGFIGYVSEFEFCANKVRNTANYTPPTQITPDADTTIHWSMNEYLPAGVTDDSGGGFNGTLTGTSPNPWYDTPIRKL